MTAPTITREDRERFFWSRVERGSPDACWLWTGAVNPSHGYGEAEIGRRGATERWRAHRLAWVIANGRAIPGSSVVMHACDNRRCVNPAHLSIGTVAENNADAMRKGRAAFARGIQPHKVHGEAHWSAKLTADDVLAIRESKEPSRSAGRKWGVSAQTIQRIRARQNWRHL